MSLKVLLVASEAMPLVKTGGLADVMGALPKALQEVGVEVCVMIPKHRIIKEKYEDNIETIFSTNIQLGWRNKYLGIQTMVEDGVKYYFIDNEDYFGGPVYLGGEMENEQYLFFCRAVCEALRYIDFDPDVLHINDWHTGMIPILLKTQYQGQFSKDIRILLSIHNIMFQGKMDFELIKDTLGISDYYYSPEFIELDGCANMLKAGIVFADKISTVSPNYAKEITTEYFGMGLDGILSARSADLVGILNGIDMDSFDPKNDPSIAGHFDVNNLNGKRKSKNALRKEFNITIDQNAPIISMVTRLTMQKGLDLVKYVLEEILYETDASFILLGSGDDNYQEYFNYIAAKFPGKAGIYIGYDEELAHRIYAGSDFLLMPSEFEPCGLSQMIAQRYGTLPIVRETGGLIDTVDAYNKYTGEGDGFAFSTFNAHDMMESVRVALEVFRDKPTLNALRKNAMAKDNSFLNSAEKYKSLYKFML